VARSRGILGTFVGNTPRIKAAATIAPGGLLFPRNAANVNSHPEHPHFAEDDTVRYVKTHVIAFINYKGIRSAEFQSFFGNGNNSLKSEAITVKPGMPVRDES
jgi:hypothetical protein